MTHDVQQLTESECLALLRTGSVGRVAVVAGDGDVDIFPINYVVDHGTIVFRTAPGTKLTRIIDAPRVTFEADQHVPEEGVWWSVMVKGDAKRIVGRDGIIELFDIDLQPWHPGPKPFFVRLEPTQVTGRRFPGGPAQGH